MMSTADGNNRTETGVGKKAGMLLSLALLTVLAYEVGRSRGRAEKTSGEYAELKAQYSALRTEYDRDYAQYSSMRSRCDQTLAQYSGLKAQYDRIEAKKAKTANIDSAQ